MAEMCLWTSWTHVGDLVSEEVSRIVIMNAEAFCPFGTCISYSFKERL